MKVVEAHLKASLDRLKTATFLGKSDAPVRSIEYSMQLIQARRSLTRLVELEKEYRESTRD